MVVLKLPRFHPTVVSEFHLTQSVTYPSSACFAHCQSCAVTQQPRPFRLPLCGHITEHLQVEHTMQSYLLSATEGGSPSRWPGALHQGSSSSTCLLPDCCTPQGSWVKGCALAQAAGHMPSSGEQSWLTLIMQRGCCLPATRRGIHADTEPKSRELLLTPQGVVPLDLLLLSQSSAIWALDCEGAAGGSWPHLEEPGCCRVSAWSLRFSQMQVMGLRAG